MDPCILPIIFLIKNIHHNPRNNKINIIANNVCFYSKKRHLNPLLPLALITHESGFRVKLKSKTKDIGLMQLHKKYIRAKCNPYKIKCNIKVGTKRLITFKKAGNLNGYHWLRRYNWNSKRHHLRVLWITEAYRKILNGHTYLFNVIRRRKYQRTKLTYQCIRKNLCGHLRMEERNLTLKKSDPILE